MHLRDQTAVVTGAASGIGRALAEQLAAQQARLVLADRDVPALTAVSRRLGAVAVEMDVASPQDNQRLASTAGAPRLLCLNAGIVSQHPGPVWEAPPDEWRRVLDVNLGGVVNGLAAFVPRMLATGQRHHILITASLAGLATWPGGGPYAASKHATVTVAQQAALALADTPVSVTVLCPALVRSGMSDVGTEPTTVAQAALEAVRDDVFAVVDDVWAPAVTAESARLAAGLPPRLPQPTAPDRDTTTAGARHATPH